VAPFAGWLRGYQHAAYLPGPLLAVVLVAGLGGILAAGRGARRRAGGPRVAPAAYPWLAAVTLLVVPVMTADYSERYVLIVAPMACLAAGLAVARAAAARPESPGHETLSPPAFHGVP
jgi:hypothetical protein